MTAQEAKALSMAALEVKVSPKIIYDHIGAATMSGKFDTQIDLIDALGTSSLTRTGRDMIFKRYETILVSEGYIVNRNVGDDQRDGPWDIMTISWK